MNKQQGKIILWIGIGIFIAVVVLLLTMRPIQSPLPEKLYKVGVVSYGGAHNQAVEGMKDEMAALGYQEGKNISYSVIDAAGSLDKVKEASQMFVAESMDAVYSITTPITIQVMQIVKEQPIIFNIVSDPVGAGIAKNWLSSGNNTTGCSNYVGQTGPKRLEVLLAILPQTKNILVLYDPDNAFAQDAIVILRKGASDLRVALSEEFVHSTDDVIAALERVRPGQYDAFFHLGEALVSSVADKVVSLLDEKQLPSMAHDESFSKRGMLVTYGASWYFLGRQCAKVLDEVLQGAKPNQIPIEIPTKMDLIINLNTARKLDINLPQEILLQADKLIE